MRTLNIPKVGIVPVDVDREGGKRPVVYIRPDSGPKPVDFRLKKLYPSVVRYSDPCRAKTSYAIEKQKVVVLTESQIKDLQNGRTSVRAIGNKRSKQLRSFNDKRGRIIVSDCPNPPDERSQELTYTVLLEWTERTPSRFPELELRDAGGQLIDLISQANNYFVISPRDPNNPPPPPPAGTGLFHDEPTDYKPLSKADIKQYKELFQDPKNAEMIKGPTVAVVDTGLKFNFNNIGKTFLRDPYTYPDADGRDRQFVLAYQDSNKCQALPNNRIGYCSLNGYKQQDFVDETNNRLTDAGLDPCDIEDVRNSPYDDHRILKPDSETLLDGRHGTTIAAIIQQQADVPILPVKAFDNLGFSTLFDILNGLNYVLQRHKEDNIRVVNASWIFGRDEPLLLDKIKQLMRAGIFVVAAAGNRRQTADRNLDNVPVYPACYSTQCPNVITVTSVTKEFSSILIQPKDQTTSPGGKVEQTLANAKVVSKLVEEAGAGMAIPALYPVPGYTAVENYSNRFVNVGVVSTFGYFPSPFQGGGPQTGSSFACAYVSAFIVEQFKKNRQLLPSGGPVTDSQMIAARRRILGAIKGRDIQLGLQAVADGCYLMS